MWKRGGGRPAWWAKWLVVILLAVIAACLLVQVGVCTSAARAQDSGAGGGSAFAIAGQLSRDSYGLYLIDYEDATICVYQYLPGAGLRLMAARTYRFDRRLDEYKTEPPPNEIREMVAEQRRLHEVTTRP